MKDEQNKTGHVLRFDLTVLALIVMLLCLCLLSFCLGRYSIPVGDVIKNIAAGFAGGGDKDITTVLFTIRIPRVFAAILIGAALSAAGAVLQNIFRNPMVSPDLLGASAGAGFGAVMAMLFSLGTIMVQASAFVMGLVAVMLAYTIAKRVSRGGDSSMSLILTGLMVGTLFQAFISIVKLVADPQSQLPTITFWLMGGLNTVQKNDVMHLLLPVGAGILLLLLLRHRINVLTLGNDEASTMGLNVELLRFVCIICATLITSSSVAVGGLIGWVGLVVPHLSRMLVGSNCSKMLPVSVLLGANYLLIVDDVARCLFPSELPLGILTALLGAPFFVYLLYKRKGAWN